MILHPQETFIETYNCNGVSVDLIEWTATVWCGKIGYAADCINEPDVEKIMCDFMSLSGKAVSRRENDWDVCLSVNYLSAERPNGVMFAFLTDAGPQPEGFDLFCIPPARFLRIRLCKETAEALDRDPWQGGIPPYEWIGEQLMPQLGYRYGDDTLPVIEYYGYYNPDKNAHTFCYLYVPAERI